jgi:hypothetical protein
MTNDEPKRTSPWDEQPAPASARVVQPTAARKGLQGRRKTILGSMVIGGIAGAAILGPISSLAASPAPTTTAPAPSGAAPTEGTEQGKGGGRSGHTEAVTDTSVVAKAIGISEADLLTALNGGQTVAQVAAAHSVSAQTVIDALVADGQSELAAEVASGSITQAQADAEKAELTQRATDQVNGSLDAGH